MKRRALLPCLFLAVASSVHAGPIAWGEPGRDGVRIGLQLPDPVFAGARFIPVEVQYHNTGKEAAEVPMHAQESVNISRLMFRGVHRAEPFTVRHSMPRLATAPLLMKTLEPGDSYTERLILQVGAPGETIGHVGLPACTEGTLSLRVGLCEAIDPHSDAHWRGAQKSGTTEIEVAADPTAERLAAFKAEIDSLRLRIEHHPEMRNGRAMPGLILHTAPVEFELRPNWDGARLDRDAAVKLLDGLAEAGFFRQARAAEGKFGQVGYVLHLDTDKTALQEVMGEAPHLRLLDDDPHSDPRIAAPFSAWLLSRRLNTLQALLAGGPRKSFDRFVRKLTAPNEAPRPKVNGNALLKEYAGQVVATASSSWPTWEPEKLIDGDPQTSWFSQKDESAALEKEVWIKLTLPADEIVRRVTILGNREPAWPKGFSVTEGVIEFYDRAGKRIWLDEQAPDQPPHDFEFIPGEPVRGVRSIRFTSTRDQGDQTIYGDVAIGEVLVE